MTKCSKRLFLWRLMARVPDPLTRLVVMLTPLSIAAVLLSRGLCTSFRCFQVFLDTLPAAEHYKFNATKLKLTSTHAEPT